MTCDFRLSCHFNTRADLIGFGERLGKVLRTKQRILPWFICVNGDFNSGKSLVGLSIDKGFRPGDYPEKLERNLHIQTIMPDWHLNKPGSLHTVFKHFGHMICETRESFDQELSELEKKNPQARLLIASNLHGGYLDSDRLDLAIRVLKAGDQFERDVELVTRDNGVIHNLRALL